MALESTQEANVIEGQIQPHRAVRTNMFIAALLRWDGCSAPVTVRNMSPGGALVEGATLPPPGTFATLCRGSLSVSGNVAWSNERRCGLHLTGMLDVAGWMARPDNTGQAQIDRAVQQYKSGVGPLTTVPPPLPAPPLSCGAQQVAQIRALEQLVADLSEALASDPETIIRHGAALQKLDLLAQGLERLRG